ncbi:hypothetical protein DFH94DRAFT_695113 [Russula ochroleuca]|uniref:Uncharacterized protein n=1 Tax=Russula ochroleuca TaxID=152965 RepID=A0A9P5MS16_9AGAM|nr:hypothetical protein DFH94DRAFT_695113 [Russula ochroleuca]
MVPPLLNVLPPSMHHPSTRSHSMHSLFPLDVLPLDSLSFNALPFNAPFNVFPFNAFSFDAFSFGTLLPQLRHIRTCRTPCAASTHAPYGGRSRRRAALMPAHMQDTPRCTRCTQDALVDACVHTGTPLTTRTCKPDTRDDTRTHAGRLVDAHAHTGTPETMRDARDGTRTHVGRLRRLVDACAHAHRDTLDDVRMQAGRHRRRTRARRTPETTRART